MQKPYGRIKRVQLSDPTKVGQAFDAMLEFIRDRQIVSMELHAARVVFVRGRGKRLTRVSKIQHDRLVITFPPQTAPPSSIAAGLAPVVDQRKGGRRR